MSILDIVDDLRDRVTGARFDPRLVRDKVIDTGEQGQRAKAVAERLNAARSGRPKGALVVWAPAFSAITRRGPWVYISRELATRLSDDGLAFVLAHEMAHHDLGHLRSHMAVAALIGFSQEMELQADREAVRLCRAAGYDPEAGFESLEPSLWEIEPRVEESEWPESLRWWAGRLKHSHPPMEARREALRAALERGRT